jgi:nucleotide-binding universal stress UspA family protein
MFKNILVATDGSKLSMKAVDEAIDLAKDMGAKLTAVIATPSYPMVYGGEGYVFPMTAPSEWDEAMKADSAKKFAAIEKRAKAKQQAVEFVTVKDDQPHNAIINIAKKKKSDLIVMASHGRRGVSALVLGSETTKVLTHSKIPVLVCR